MSYHFSAEQEEVCSAQNSSDFATLDTLNGMDTVNGSSHSESLTDILTVLQSSEMCVSSFSPVRLENTEDLQMWLRQVSPASHSARPASNLEPTTPETCGQQQGTVFATYSLNPFCLKTCRDLFPADISEPSLLNWPRWGMWGDGELLEQPTPSGLVEIRQQITNAIDCGFLQRWPTPRANSAMAAAITPENSWAERFPNLETMVGRKTFVRYPTPCASENKNRGNLENPSIQRRLKIGKQLMLSMVVGGNQTQPMTLNPEWVEWLQGWPTGWTDLKPLGMDKFQQWLSAHGRN